MKKKLSHRAVIATRAAVVVALLVLAILISQVLTATGPIVRSVDPDAQLPRVNVFAAVAVPVQRQWTGYGTAEAVYSANVPARVTATVTRIPSEVLEGAAVTAGQVLIELDDSDYVNQLRIAQQNLAGVQARLDQLDTQENWLTQRLEVEASDLALAQDELERIKNLFKRSAANQKDVDAADRAVLSARRGRLLVEESLNGMKPRRDQLLAEQAGLVSSADTARQNLERCSIRSPIDGVLQFVDVEVGENLTPGQRVARVVNLQRVQTPLSLPANARSHIRVGDSVRLTSTANPNLFWDSTLARITPEDDPQTRTFYAYVEVIIDQTSKPDRRDARAMLAPGVFVSGVVREADSRARLVVPRRSIRTQRVMVIRDGYIQSNRVSEDYAYQGALPTLGLPDDQWAVLDSGIEAGDLVVLNPTRSLSDGQQVDPVEVDRDEPNTHPARDDRAAGDNFQGAMK